MRCALAVLGALLGLTVFAGAAAAEGGDLLWDGRADLLRTAGSPTVAALAGKVYAVETLDDDSFASVHEYDPATNQWRARSSLTGAGVRASAAAADGRLFVVGGYTRDGALAGLAEYDPAADRWTPRAPMPTARYGLGLSALNGKLYAVGGTAGAEALAAVEEYDPAADRWSVRAPLPTARDHVSLVALGDRLYALGGASDAGGAAATVDEYDPAADRWTSRAPMLFPRYGAAAAAAHGRIYVFGGASDEGPLGEAEEYDPAGDFWTELPALSSPRGGLAAAQIADGVLLVVGGYGPASAGPPDDETPFGAHSAVELFDPAARDWVGPRRMPSSRTAVGVAAEAGGVYVVGGDDGRAPLPSAQRYDVAANRWSTLADLEVPRSALGLAAAGGRLYALGGRSADEALAAVEEYDPTTDRWRPRADMPTPRYSLAAVAVGARLFAIGGYADRGLADDVEEYDPAADTWVARARLPTPRYGLAAAVVDGKVYAIGGHDALGPSAAVEEYDPVADRWTARASLPVARFDLAAAALGARIFALGGLVGEEPSANVSEYDPRADRWYPQPPLLTPRHGLGAAALDGRVVAVAGTAAGPSAALELARPEHATVAVALSPAPNEAGWHNQPVRVELTSLRAGQAAPSSVVYAVDGGPTTSYEAPFVVADGFHSIAFAPLDVAGRPGPTQTTTLKVDATVPTIQATVLGQRGSGGWHTSPVTLDYRCEDAGGSGIATCPPPITLGNDGIGMRVTASAVDAAGNVADALSSFSIDQTPPELRFTGNNAVYDVDDAVSIACQAIDALAGVATATCPTLAAPAYTLPPGANTLTASATDRAGNVAGATTMFVVRVTYDSLCALSRQFVTRRGAELVLCVELRVAERLGQRGRDRAQEHLLRVYGQHVESLRRRGELTADQAATLIRLARAL
jgi:N-acetylneuraminic acid mutarotase